MIYSIDAIYGPEEADAGGDGFPRMLMGWRGSPGEAGGVGVYRQCVCGGVWAA